MSARVQRGGIAKRGTGSLCRAAPPVEEDGDEVFIPIKDVRCRVKVTCGGARLEKLPHDNNDTLYWRCPKCGSYYGAVNTRFPSKE